MDIESFHDLALRVIAGEATAADRQALEVELSVHPERKDDFEQMKITHDVLRTTAPMTEASRATGPELPAYRVGELRTAVRQHFGPAASRQKSSGTWVNVLRWILAGGGVTALTVLVVILNLSGRTIEVGMYQTDAMRNGEATLAAQDVPAAKIVTFDQDASFDQWQSQSLKWYERAKIWVDNEHDVLNIVHRIDHGRIQIEHQPLAPTDEGQREQIKQAVESLQK
jgi:hypothetical protein